MSNVEEIEVVEEGVLLKERQEKAEREAHYRRMSRCAVLPIGPLEIHGLLDLPAGYSVERIFVRDRTNDIGVIIRSDALREVEQGFEFPRVRSRFVNRELPDGTIARRITFEIEADLLDLEAQKLLPEKTS